MQDYRAILSIIAIIAITILIQQIRKEMKRQEMESKKRILEITLNQIESRILFKMKHNRITMRGVYETWRQTVAAAKDKPSLLHEAIAFSKQLEKNIDEQYQLKHRSK